MHAMVLVLPLHMPCSPYVLDKSEKKKKKKKKSLLTLPIKLL